MVHTRPGVPWAQDAGGCTPARCTPGDAGRAENRFSFARRIFWLEIGAWNLEQGCIGRGTRRAGANGGTGCACAGIIRHSQGMKSMRGGCGWLEHTGFLLFKFSVLSRRSIRSCPGTHASGRSTLVDGGMRGRRALRSLWPGYPVFAG